MYNKNNLLNTSLVSLVIAYFLCLFSISVQAKGKSPEITKKIEKSRYKRIISLKPNITQTLQAFGLTDKIVGVTKFCAKPSPEIEVIGDYNSVDIEKVIRLKPDLILGSMENSRKKQYDVIKKAGLNLKFYDFSSYENMKSSLMAIGKLLKLTKTSEEIIKKMEEDLSQLRPFFQESKIKKTFIAIIQRRPLMVASGNTYISSVFQNIGLVNTFGNNRIAYPVIDEEEFIRELVDYTFDLSHDATKEEKTFLNKNIIPLKIEDFLASPQSVENLVAIFLSPVNVNE